MYKKELINAFFTYLVPEYAHVNIIRQTAGDILLIYCPLHRVQCNVIDVINVKNVMDVMPLPLKLISEPILARRTSRRSR
jgi:hypothetical protein